MVDVLVLHHAQGLTPGIREFASVLAAAGHRVSTPDYYEGLTFTTVEEGVAHAHDIGFDTVLARAAKAAAALPAESVYAGFSLGAMPAQLLAQTRPGAQGALLYHGAAPASVFGVPWPSGVRLQIHAMDEDPWFVEDLEAARELVDSVAGAELFLYPGTKHLFADSSLDDYEPEAAGLLVSRTIECLRRVDRER